MTMKNVVTTFRSFESVSFNTIAILRKFWPPPHPRNHEARLLIQDSNPSPEAL